MNTSYEKLLVAVRYWLLGRQFNRALQAMEFALQYHKGKRQGGAPEFIHQLEIVSYLRTLPMEPNEDLMCATFLHDVVEDYGVSLSEIEMKFGTPVKDLVNLASKEIKNEKKSSEQYFKELSGNPLGALLKGGDRIANQNSMIGVFSIERLKKYLKETKEFIIPMIKKARRNFPQYEPALENEKLLLQTQVIAIEEIISLMEKAEALQKLSPIQVIQSDLSQQ